MDWKKFLSKTRENYKLLNEEIPETFRGFSVMGEEAKKNGLVDLSLIHI